MSNLTSGPLLNQKANSLPDMGHVKRIYLVLLSSVFVICAFNLRGLYTGSGPDDSNCPEHVQTFFLSLFFKQYSLTF